MVSLGVAALEASKKWQTQAKIGDHQMVSTIYLSASLVAYEDKKSPANSHPYRYRRKERVTTSHVRASCHQSPLGIQITHRTDHNLTFRNPLLSCV